ncbi:hypothetical protein AG1IA_02886 [Rhizoctonia solani AG-1 IA]|uniref:Uncharacterized protein n=1 Tax=Thanatephorus cucumeris (strain AG1-IA) TaxID=983506 RepID=L8WYJ5_THACA|nr:hypothetical protein AG1IA_02886 [Rhizoctonia solani AG-1 IA]
METWLYYFEIFPGQVGTHAYFKLGIEFVYTPVIRGRLSYQCMLIFEALAGQNLTEVTFKTLMYVCFGWLAETTFRGATHTGARTVHAPMVLHQNYANQAAQPFAG